MQEEVATGGSALPWVDRDAFARRAIDLALCDRERARSWEGWVFFDRSLIDAVTALGHDAIDSSLGQLPIAHRYHPTVFLTPPWPEIYQADAERKLGWDDAVAEYDRLVQAYPMFGYRIVVLPKASVEQRADLVLAALGTVRQQADSTLRNGSQTPSGG